MSFCITKDSNIQKNALQFLRCIDSIDEETKVNETNGKILSNSKYSWLVNGSKIVICSCKNGARVGSWDFQTTLDDDTCVVVDVDEIQRSNGREPLLAISVNCDSIGGVICIFDFLGSKIIRAINIGEEISSLHVIDSGQDVINLSGPLRNFDGVLVVGTAGANVYIVDLYRQLCDEGFGSLRFGEEFKMYQMKIITSEDLHDIEDHKQDALQFGSHLAIHLNVVLNKQTEHFVLKEPNGTDKVHVDRQEVLVSALHYCPQLGSLLVGYNFGAFQLWNLMTMALTYTSPICEDHIPITKFAIQEPADDPRAYCYVWAVYSIDNSDSGLLPYLVMYAMCFESKEIQESYGILYENFQYCVVRFHMELGFNHQSIVDIKGGKCLKLESIVQKISTNSEICVVDGGEEILSICIVLWRAVSENGPQTFMSVFDLNQWYKEQMPNSPNADDCGNYMITLCATDLTSTVEEQLEVLDMVVQKKKLQQFVGVQKLEEHYYPSSLSFDVCCLLENKIIAIQYQGVQRALLYQIQSSGPLCLIRPTEIYEEIYSLGLMPLFVEISQHLPISLSIQREIILNVALEQQMTDWLCKCASEWANGSFSSAGCSLELLISWAFQRGIVLKNSCDNICKSLFDHSQIRLDGNTSNILNNCIRQIKNISLLYTFILKNFSNFLPDNDLLLERCQSLHMVEVYFDVLQWLFNVGLLPEYAPNDVIALGEEDKIRAPYPAEELVEYYRTRRAELQLKQKRHFPMNSSVLFIDNLIDKECSGDQLSKEWKNDGGDGFYPPRSLQALLRTYLKDGIEVCNKHAVVIYLFLDLAMILDPEKYSSVTTHLIKFPAVFKVSPSLIKITQAFWQLDHGDFSTAMEQLLDPLVNSDDLKYWHHRLALKSLLIQDQPNAALLYMNVKKPPIIDDEDVLCALSLYISNNMLDEAFYMENLFLDHFNSQKLIKHLFSECSLYGHLGNVINRNLTNEEETLFLEFLDEVQHPEAADLKVAYFMQRNHYIEAFKIYSKDQDPLTKGLVGQLTAKTRDHIVHNYKKLLPTVTYKFIESCTKEPNSKVWNEILINKSNPVSVIMHKTKDYPEYMSSIPFTFMAKAKQITAGELKSSFLLTSKTEETPFLRTSTVLPSRKRPKVPVIKSKLLEKEDKYGPSPSKRPRLSPPSVSHIRPNIDSSILETPIIQRKDRSQVLADVEISRDPNTTPSILKNSPFISKRHSISRSNVRFDIPKSTVPSPVESTKSLNESIEKAKVAQTSPVKASKSLTCINNSLAPKDTSDPEVFYSPNESLDNDDIKIDEKPEDDEFCEKMEVCYEEDVAVADEIEKPESSHSESITTTPRTSPQSRRSYKSLLNEQPLLKSSPRFDTTKLSSFRKSNSDEKQEAADSPRVQPRKPLHLNYDDSSLSKSVSGESSHISIFHTENKNLTTIGSEVETEISCAKTEYSDVYSMESSTPEKISERHSVIKTASSFREIEVDSDTESTPGEKLSSDSFMEYLVDDLRQRHSRLKEEKDQKNENPIATEPAPIIRRSRRLSAERSLPCDEIKKNDKADAPLLSLSSRTRRKSSEERTLPTEDMDPIPRTRRSSVDRTLATETPARRSSRRLSAERTVETPSQSTSSTKPAPRASRRLSEERNVPTADSDEKKIEVLNLSPSRRITRRLSAERTIPTEPLSASKGSEEKVELLKLTASPRTGKILSAEKARKEEIPEAHCSSTPDERPVEVPTVENNIPSSSGISQMFSPSKEIRRDSKVTYRKPIRKSLSRQVLENNTLVRLASEARKSDEQLNLLTKSSSYLMSRQDASTSKAEATSHEQSKEECSGIEETIEEVIAMSELENTKTAGNISLSDSLLDMLNNFDNSSSKTKVKDSINEDETVEANPLSTSKSQSVETMQEPLENKEETLNVVDVDDSEQQDSKYTNLQNVPLLEECVQTHHEDISIVYDDLDDPIKETNVCELSQDVNLNKGRIEESDVIHLDDTDLIFETSNEFSLNKGRIEENAHEKTTIAPSTPSAFERNIILDPDVIVLDENEHSRMEKDEVINLDSSSENEDVQSVESVKTTHTSSSNSSSASSKTTIIMNQRILRKSEQGELGRIVEEAGEDEEKGRDNLEVRDEEPEKLEKTEVESKEDKEERILTEKSGGVEESHPGFVSLGIQTEDVIEEKSVQPIVPARRITRRSSRLSDSGNDVEKLSVLIPAEDKKKADSVSKKSQSTRLSVDPSSPSKVNLSVKFPEILRPTSVSKPTKTYSRKRTRSCDTVPLDENAGASTSRAEPVTAARRNLRSASVEPTTDTKDVPTVLDKDENMTESSSVCDEGSSTEKRSKRKPAKVEKKTAIATYALTRRLTRRQANLLEKTITEVDEQMVETSPDEVLSSVEQQDRIELLDKPNFEGVPDPDEQKIYDASPSSSVKSDSISNSGRRTRRSSVSSKSSGGSNILPDSPKSKGPRRRLRSASIEKEDSVKRTKTTEKKKTSASGKSSDDSSQVGSTRRTRSKKGDEKAADSDSSSVKSTRSTRSKKSDTSGTRSRKKVPSKLPEIIEEPSEEEEKSQVSRRKRK